VRSIKTPFYVSDYEMTQHAVFTAESGRVIRTRLFMAARARLDVLEFLKTIQWLDAETAETLREMSIADGSRPVEFDTSGTLWPLCAPQFADAIS
jgi:hypothetical protein